MKKHIFSIVIFLFLVNNIEAQSNFYYANCQRQYWRDDSTIRGKTKRTFLYKHNFARKLPEKQWVILNFAGWAGQNKLYRKLYFGLIFDGRGARFL